MSNENEVTPNGSPNPHPTTSVVATVCCGCGHRPPKERRWRMKSVQSWRRRPSAKYFDAEVGNESIWENVDKESQYYFDAEEEALKEDEYPILFTTALQHPKPIVSLEAPETLLRTSKSIMRQESAPPIESHKRLSERFLKIARRPTLEHHQELKMPRVKIPLQGYPGELTFEELVECQKFLRGLKLLDPTVSEQIYSFRDIEEDPYTICRWLRATKFDAEKILQRCDENQDMYDQAKQQEFYPDVAAAIGAPFPVFLSQYPFLPIGRAKNGCPVNYFQAGKIQPEGILCMTTIPRMQGYFWWSFMHKMKEEIRKAQALDPDFVRIEGINVIDLQGLSASALSSETMEVIKLASKISDFFPETLHCMLVLNAPSFFAMSWPLIKKFIDPRTAQRIQVFSNEQKGLQALQRLVSPEQIPTDYGGTYQSVKHAFTKESADPLLRRQEIELIHVRKRGTTSNKNKWESLSREECMTIRVYTRSASAAILTIQFNGALYKTVQVQSAVSETDGEPHCQSLLVVSKLRGPGTVTFELQDLDTAPKKHNGLSRGYFLLAGDVKGIDHKEDSLLSSRSLLDHNKKL